MARLTVEEIESAISQLPKHDLTQLAAWFEEFQAHLWDKQIEEDFKAGRLDALVQEAEKEYEAGDYRAL